VPNSSDRCYIDNRYIMDDVEQETNHIVVGERNGFSEKRREYSKEATKENGSYERQQGDNG
jgi:hypothetical protein